VSLFGSNPPTTMDVKRASRIAVDALLAGWDTAAKRHGIGPSSIRRIHSMRDECPRLDDAIKKELVATPANLTTSGRILAWVQRGSEESVDVEEDGVTVTLQRFRPRSPQ